MADAIIVGAGPAGLSAALLLGRCRRRVIVFDDGEPRNLRAHRLHGFLTRDGTPPLELLRLAREELLPYASVAVRAGRVIEARCVANGFEVELASGERADARKLLIATGLVDDLLPIEGLAALYGRTVLHCPYCDGWEIRDQPVAVGDSGAHGVAFALELTCWTRDLVLCTNGAQDLSGEEQERLARHGIAVRCEPIVRLEGRDGHLERIVFASGPPLPRRAFFFDTHPRQRSPLLEKLGCLLTTEGDVPAGRRQTTHLPGLYVAGDASRSVRLAIVAASEGAEAAFDINAALVKEDLGLAY